MQRHSSSNSYFFAQKNLERKVSTINEKHLIWMFYNILQFALSLKLLGSSLGLCGRICFLPTFELGLPIAANAMDGELASTEATKNWLLCLPSVSHHQPQIPR